MFTSLIAAGAAALAAPPSDVGEQLERAGYTAVALRPTKVGHLHTEGQLNGTQVEVLVDTGASNTVIDIELARQLGLRLTGAPRTGAGVGDAAVAVMMVDGASLTVWGVTIRGPLYAMDFTAIRSALAVRGSVVPSVVLGGNAMRAMDAVLAYRQNQLFLRAAPRPRS